MPPPLQLLFSILQWSPQPLLAYNDWRINGTLRGPGRTAPLVKDWGLQACLSCILHLEGVLWPEEDGLEWERRV